VCKLTKRAHFLPTTETAIAHDTAVLLKERIFPLHGVPSSIVSDRDLKFTFDVWKELFSLLGTRLKFSTANHPQTDGQTERTC